MLTYQHHIGGLAQDCSNSIADALELLQSCAKPSIKHCTFLSTLDEATVMSIAFQRVKKS